MSNQQAGQAKGARRPKFAIACATGGFKGAFIHGVLAAFEERNIRAEAYGAASSSVIPAAVAVAGLVRQLGHEYWLRGLEILSLPGTGMSGMILAGIEQTGPLLVGKIFRPGRPRLLIAANAVDEEGAEVTQGKGARRLGRRLLLAAARGDRSWVEQHLTLHLFDTGSTGEQRRLSAANFNEVAYASSRMLHAWDLPAWVEGRPYIDAFYTNACPALEMAEMGYDQVITIASEPKLYRDMFQEELIPSRWLGIPIRIIGPEYDPETIGVSYTKATAEGLKKLYDHGWQIGQKFIVADSVTR